MGEAAPGGLVGLVSSGGRGAASLRSYEALRNAILRPFLRSRLTSQEESSIVSWWGGGHRPLPTSELTGGG